MTRVLAMMFDGQVGPDKGKAGKFLFYIDGIARASIERGATRRLRAAGCGTPQGHRATIIGREDSPCDVP